MMRHIFVFWLMVWGLVACAPVDEPAPVVTMTQPAMTPVAAASLTPTTTPSATATISPTLTPIATLPPIVTPSPAPTAIPFGESQVIGYSVEGRSIASYQFGTGQNVLVLVGGMHGGYEWNSIMLMYELITYLTFNPDEIPATVTLYIIPSANPDGQFRATGEEGPFFPGDVDAETIPGRFNAHGVDLNRNWPCNWEPTGIWRDQAVSAGTSPLSEPESLALHDFLLAQQPELTVFFHSAINGVFASGCGTIHPQSLEWAERYAAAADYPAYTQFTSYPITGDAADWLTTQDLSAITVELRTHEGLDWFQNLAGLQAILTFYR